MTVPKLALTFEEAAEACGYSVRTLKYQVAAGNLMARYANSKGVIRVEDLAQWLDDLPAEPKAGHRPVSALDEGEKDVISGDAPDSISSDDGKPASKAMFRTPEEVAPELGLAKSKVRDLARASGIHTRVGRRIMLTQEDIDNLVVWIRGRKEAELAAKREHDPFA